MKSQALKTLIKESVREVIQEELREILLEAVKAPKQTISTPPPTTSVVENKPISEDKRAAYANILGETASQFTSQDVSKFNPQGVMPGADLPQGNVGMDQIMGLLNSK
jgi:hypothetical protein